VVGDVLDVIIRVMNDEVAEQPTLVLVPRVHAWLAVAREVVPQGRVSHHALLGTSQWEEGDDHIDAPVERLEPVLDALEVSYDERAEDRVDELAADPVDVVVVDVAVDALAVGLGKVDDLLLPPVGGLNRRGQRTKKR
jgi:hypothetical protein